jgi:dipeptidyl aminopeptidase/acylaminoacyl peptidase
LGWWFLSPGITRAACPLWKPYGPLPGIPKNIPTKYRVGGIPFTEYIAIFIRPKPINDRKMRYILILLAIHMATLFSLWADEQPVVEWLVAGPFEVSEPGFILGENLKGEPFSHRFILEQDHMNMHALHPQAGRVFKWSGRDESKWEKQEASKDGYIRFNRHNNESYQIMYSALYVESEILGDYVLEIESPQMFEVYLNGQMVGSSNKVPREGETATSQARLGLGHGKSVILVKSLSASSDSEWKIKARISESNNRPLMTSISPEQGMNIHHLLEGTKLGSASLSPDGTLLAVTYNRTNTGSGENNTWTEVRDFKTGRIIQSFRKDGTTGYHWTPMGKKLYYTTKNEFGSSIWVFDFETGEEYAVMKGIDDLSGFQFSSDEGFIIYGVSEEEEKEKPSSLKYMDELGNRTFQPGRETYLFQYDISSGISQRLTFGKEGTRLQDISRDGRHMVFSTSTYHPTERPFSHQSMFIMELNTGRVDTLWKDMLWGGSARFSPDGQKLLVTGGPDCFGAVGLNIGDQPMANNYDNQLYIFDIESGTIDPITEHFDPSVATSIWHPVDNRIYFTATDEIYQRAFSWDPDTRQFHTIATVPEVVGSFNMASETLLAAYTGSGLGQYNKLWGLDLTSDDSRLIEDPEADTYEHVVFGNSEEWNFTTADGTEIRGYFLYPRNFDRSKKYPLIVNYYGGTMPISKSFGGRYPMDIWAAEGYVVYVPQPSGAIGFGQEFSARHQNNWGQTVAHEIIEGTKKFIADHSFVDPENIGCIGASYGGFMTMYLQTQTDIYTCAISHAGISSLSSYWGEGYWGYAYSSEATGNSYPWNRRDIYVDQSPLFSADKINTPLLLLHGSLDTNVPLGESLQLWVGLKILGKPVEMIQVEGENHHILTYSKRIEWHQVIMAWFDKWLKDQNHDWKKLVPKSTL